MHIQMFLDLPLRNINYLAKINGVGFLNFLNHQVQTNNNNNKNRGIYSLYTNILEAETLEGVRI